MGHSHHAPSAPAVENLDRAKLGSLPMIFLGVGVVGLLVSLLGLIVPAWRQQFAFSWLFACTYFFTLCCGGLFWTLIHHATDAEWSVVVRRQLENLGSLIPVFFFLFLPLFACAGYLWGWWDITAADHRYGEYLEKSGFLNKPFFIIRYVAYFVFLGGVIWLLRRSSIKQDKDGSSRHSHFMRRLAIFGLIAFGVSLTFAAVDWLMSLNFLWYSTMWGVYIFAGTAGASMSLLVVIVTFLRSMGYLKPVTLEHYHMMGKWMLAFTIFWAYIGFDQYMLIWYANIPEENIYFRIRNTESWHFFSTLLVVGRFFIPFPILLTQWIKKQPIRLCYLACWILFMQLIDIYVVVLPSLHKTGFRPSFFDLFALLGVGGLVGWLWMRRIGSAHLFPTRDPRLSGSLSLTN